MNNYFKLEDVADVKLSNVDKKVKTGEKEIRLCNYTDVYKNTYIDKNRAVNFMIASCNEKEFEKFLLKKGQVSITKDSEKANDIGVSTYIEEDFQDVVLGYHLALITPYKEKLDGKYLNYWFNTSQAKRYFENNVGGSGQRFTLPLDIILSTPLCLPNIENQKKISSILFSLDKKIQLLHQINDNLAELAKTIYDYWFVQFDFPDENGKPYKSSGGKMVYNEVLKREIPEGWEVKKIEDYCDIFTGKKDVNQSIDKGKYKFFSCSPKHRYSNDKLYEGKAILVSGNGSYTGRTIFVNCAFDLYQRTYACVPKDKKNNFIEYLYYSLCHFFVLRVSGGTHGSAIPYIVYNDIAQEYFLYNEKIIQKFMLHILPIQDKLNINIISMEELQSLRDWLLPMLMNGQISVK